MSTSGRTSFARAAVCNDRSKRHSAGVEGLSALTVRDARVRRHRRVRGKIFGSAERPRLVVFRSNRGIEAQLVDDLEGKTLAAASWLQLKGTKGSKTEQAAQVGKLLAENAKKAGVETVVFDRGGYLYHGRVKALADAAREGGLKF
jgi:large subunit ribosomal protein L18